MIIAVAGTAGGMGRTTTALGLASAAAAAGHYTVLIDGDSYQHDAAAAARSMTELAQILGHEPPLRVLPLDWQETVRWASGQVRSDQVSILDLASVNQDEVLKVAQAVVVPVPAGQEKLVDSLLPMRFRMVAAEMGAPVFALVHSVRRSGGPAFAPPPLAHLRASHPADEVYVSSSELERQGVRPLTTRIPYSLRIVKAARSPWASDWSVFADLYGPAWAELRAAPPGVAR